jgi:hypothetical protein
MVDLKIFFSNKINFKQIDFKKVPTKQWVKMTIVCLLYILFIVWVGNYWWLLLLPFIADIYITKLIPWTFWKNIKNRIFKKSRKSKKNGKNRNNKIKIRFF